MKLHPAKRCNGNGRIYCGPTALCAITGMPYEDIRLIVNEIKGTRPNAGVMRMSVKLFKKVLHYLDIQYTYVLLANTIPFGFFLYKNKPRNDEIWVVHLTKHFVTISDSCFIDNHTKSVVPLTEALHLRKRVKGIFKIQEYNKI
jgi:hypothetical protein